MRPEQRALYIARAVLCCVASFVSVWFVLVGTAAEATIAIASFYAAFEAFDERIRRRPE